MADTRRTPRSSETPRLARAPDLLRASRPADAQDDRADASVLHNWTRAQPPPPSNAACRIEELASLVRGRVEGETSPRRFGVAREEDADGGGGRRTADAAETDTAWRDAYEDAVVPFVLGGFARVRRSRDAWYLTSAPMETRVLRRRDEGRRDDRSAPFTRIKLGGASSRELRE